MNENVKRARNFGAGPAILPEQVLREAQEELLSLKGSGMSILEISHRSGLYEDIQASAEAKLRRLLGVSDDYDILFLQGGASLQFAMVPMNFATPDKQGAYVLTGSWSEKALQEAQTIGEPRVAASTKENGYRTIVSDWQDSDNDAYVHITSNNTIFGTQWHSIPKRQNCPLVVDMSSDMLSRPFDMSGIDLVYAGAQKNLGPSGVTLVIVKKSWVEQANTAGVPKMLRYATHTKGQSRYNTPPVYAVYVFDKVLNWMEQNGGLAGIAKANEEKAAVLYNVIDESNGFYKGYADPSARSLMNVTFNLSTPELEKEFVAKSKEAGFIGLNGHRSVGGCRASIYNAQPLESCQALAEFMVDFQRQLG